jgi:hypothetical protein
MPAEPGGSSTSSRPATIDFIADEFNGTPPWYRD